MKYTLEQLNQASQKTLAETLGMQIIEASPGKISITMPVSSKVHQPMGLLHGGASVALAETAASMGGWLLVAEENKVVVGQEINANHLRSIKEEVLENKTIKKPYEDINDAYLLYKILSKS